MHFNTSSFKAWLFSFPEQDSSPNGHRQLFVGALTYFLSWEAALWALQALLHWLLQQAPLLRKSPHKTRHHSLCLLCLELWRAHVTPSHRFSLASHLRLLHLSQLPAGTQYSHLCFFRISDNPFISSFGASSLGLGKEEASHRKGGDSTST